MMGGQGMPGTGTTGVTAAAADIRPSREKYAEQLI